MSTLQINDLINPARLRLGIKRAFTGDIHEILSEAFQNSARAGARNIWITTDDRVLGGDRSYPQCGDRSYPQVR